MLRLAWQFLRYDRAKSTGALLGAIVSVFLIGQQIGIAAFLTDAMVAPLRLAPADLWVVDARSEDVNALGVLDGRVVRQVASTPGTRRTTPLILAGATARFDNGTFAPVTLLGAIAPQLRGFPPLERGRPDELFRDGAVGFDRYDRGTYGGADLGSTLEINGQRAFLAVRSASLRTFSQPILFTQIDRARRYAGLPFQAVHAVLVDAEPGTDLDRLARDIQQRVPGVKAWTSPALMRATQRKILATTGIAASIGTLVLFAILVGFVIIGLTLYSAVVDRLRDFGTMKAIGAADRAVSQLVLVQATLVAVVGSLLGVLLVVGFRHGVRANGVLFSLSPGVWAALVCGTVVIAATGALFAIRRLKALEPAAVFRS